MANELDELEDLAPLDRERHRFEAVNLYLKGPSGEPAEIGARYGQYSQLLEGISKAALENSATLSDEIFEQLIERAVNVIWLLRGAFVDRETRDADKDNDFWQHNPSLPGKARLGKLPDIERTSIEVAASDYVELPFRCQAVDRIMIEALFVAEYIPFLAEIFRKPLYRGDPPGAARQPHILREFVKGHSINIAVGAAIVAALLFVGSINWIPMTWALGVSAVCGFFVLGSLAIGTVALPFVWRQQSREREKLTVLMNSMSSAYAAINSTGLISAHHVRGCLDLSVQKGAIWPATLYVLLDDIEKRDGRF